MAAIQSSGTSAVLPTGYYTSQGLAALSPAQLLAAQGAQTFQDARQSLAGSLFGGTAAANTTVLGIQIGGASSPGALAAGAGLAAQQQSQSQLLGTLTETAGWLPSSIFQLNLVQSLTRSGLLGFSTESPTQAQSVSSGVLDQSSDRQLLLQTLTNPLSSSGGSAGTPLSSYLSSAYGRSNQLSLIPRGSNVGQSLNTAG